MTVGQLAKHVGLHVTTVRRLERLGIVKATRDVNGWRSFDEGALKTLCDLYKRGPATTKGVPEP